MSDHGGPLPADFAATRVMLIAAPNGARRGKTDHAALPVTADEVAACARELLEQQVAVLHLHVRDPAGGHTLDADAYREALRAVRDAVGDRLVVQLTTEAVGRYAPDEQMQVVRDVQPEAVSLALRELCPDDDVPADTAAFFAWLNDARIWPQFILYDADDVRRFDRLRRDGVLANPRPHALFVLGRYSDALQGDPAELQSFLDAADCRAFPWSVCCFGRREHDAALFAIANGGHVRLGFENNLHLPDGQLADNNAALFAELGRALAGSTRRPATAAEVRAWVFGAS